MIHAGKKNILGIGVDAVDYEAAVHQILEAARHQRGFTVSALAVHGVMTGVSDPEHRYRLNRFDLICPDGQPVRWMLNLSASAGLTDRVYGPFLTLKLCKQASEKGIPLFFFGSSQQVLERLSTSLKERFPGIRIAGTRPSRFRKATPQEIEQDVHAIKESGAAITFVGLGCPRQEVWAYEMKDKLGMPIISVGAAFDFLSGNLEMAPPWMQRMGLEWFFRLLKEPGRLWQRYLILNSLYCFYSACQLCGVRTQTLAMENAIPPQQKMNYG